MRVSVICLAFCVATPGASLAAESMTPLPASFAVDLCAAVAGQMIESDPTKGTAYTYQTMIYAGAGVDAKTDNPEIIRRKVQRLWNTHWRDFRCASINFTIMNGNVLKLSVERNSNNFLNDMIRKWQIDINVIDPVDNETVLDYVDRELSLARARNSPLVDVLQNRQNLILKFGGKRAHELN